MTAASGARRPRGWRRLFLRGDLLHPLWRALLFLFGLVGADIALGIVSSLAYLLWTLATGQPMEEVAAALAAGRLPRLLWLATGVSRLAAALGLALLLGWLLDREPPETMGLAPARWAREGGLGLLFGAGTMLAAGALVWAVAPHPTLRPGGATAPGLAVDLVAFLTAAAAEEVAFRGYLQRLFATWKGPVAGVLVPSLLFALFHGLNPHVSPLALLNIGLAGVVFALATEWTGTLWLAVGYHFAWNFVQGSVLGLPVSGMAWEGLLSLPVGGPPLLTGGAFGPEGGLASTLVLLLSLIPLRAMARRPATTAGALRRQRAHLERHFGPLPYRHHTLRVGPRFFRDGEESLMNCVRREGEVVLLLRRADGRVLLHTKSFYPPGAYRLPSGGIQQGETVLEAAAREVAEETGLVARNLRPLGALSYRVRNGHRRLFFHSWLVAADLEGDPASCDDGEGITDFRWVEPEALSEVAAALRGLGADWADWGRFRALAHDTAAMWLERSRR